MSVGAGVFVRERLGVICVDEGICVRVGVVGDLSLLIVDWGRWRSWLLVYGVGYDVDNVGVIVVVVVVVEMALM